MRFLGSLIFLCLAFLGAVRWRSRGRSVPAYVHILALVGLALGVGMAWLDYSIGELQIARAALEVVVMPVVVYVGFFAYSGRLAEKQDAER